MTKIYFVRHAEPDLHIRDDFTRPLSEKGKEDAKKVTSYLMDKNIDIIYSSPFLRAVDTVKNFADFIGMSINTVFDLREREISKKWIEDFDSYAKQQWSDENYKLPDGECLREVKERNIKALHEILKNHRDKHIVIGTHGTALSTIIQYYNDSFTYEQFRKVQGLMPWIVVMDFDGMEYKGLIHYDVIDKKNFLI